MEVIQRHLASDEQKRLQDLRDRCEWGELTAIEHGELIQYEDRLEQWRVERLQDLIELAKLNKIDTRDCAVSSSSAALVREFYLERSFYQDYREKSLWSSHGGSSAIKSGWSC